MPSSARKSSVGTARRALQKAHIPYRGDNPEVGKKTGIAVAHVERKSDGFEPFEEIMQQADGRTPPRPKGRKKSSIRYYDEAEDEDDEGYSDDEFGEMSMQLDSPVHNLTNVRPPTTPTANGRSGSSSSRPVARSSNVDFDKIPSPRPRKAANAGPGPSNLSRSYIPRNRQPSSEPEDDMDVDDDAGGGGGDNDQEEEQGRGRSSPRRTSFNQMNHDDDDDDDDENEPFNDFPEEPYEEPSFQEPERAGSETPRPKKSEKGKGRAVQQESEDDQVEDDIARGLSDVNGTHYSDDDEPEPEPEPAEPTPEPEPAPVPKKKKVKISDQKAPQPIRTKTQSNKENRDYPPGVRRSRREHIKPLEYWRGERVVYGRPDFSQVDPVKVLPIPQIREIIRIPKEPAVPLGKRKRGHSQRARSKTAEPGGPHSKNNVRFNPEDGWDDETPSNATVLDYRTGNEVERRIAWTAKMVNPQPVANNTWSFDKIFGDADFIASGQLVIPPNSRKPSKATKDNTYIFYVIEGAVNLKIHETSLVLSTGGMFMVPRGNMYFIENIGQRDAKIFFTQARKTMNDDDERLIALANRDRKRQRSSSAGAMATRRTSAAPSNDATPLTARTNSRR
ncbi:hypothetical protein FA13DRAFT_1744891 [Coprinellus micaceus]|uniref:CENP-C homolog n=1 Tax=Coprinellus micaceus TaxID=71717 RepID=A0A4Y7SBS7_COPMI|nr:hypothetical protein FA13DRAFT_1744891 [Coprinellus micaceus]